MGIRYYAYAFDAELTAQALADPSSILSSDPLADAWGLERHANVSVATLEQVVSKRDMLYLDKSWFYLQEITRPRPPYMWPRPAYRMFEGTVTVRGLGWERWVRALTPDELVEVVRDLEEFTDDDVAAIVRGGHTSFGPKPNDEVDYVTEYLERARLFARALARDGRGMVYMIG